MRLILAATFLQSDVELCEESANWADQKIFLQWAKRPLLC
jgi:hypothetical protein